jgi:simple sugar transport system substrate-binding protein
MEAFLKAEGKKINVLFAHNDDMAIGAIQAIEEAGLKPAKDIVIISIDGVKGAFEAMIAGKLNVSVECSPLLGPQLMQAVKDIKDGKTLPKRIVTVESIFPMEVAAKEFPNRKY